MSFVLMILKNLFRQKVRTGLTVLGISIGITTVVTLGVITSSVKSSAGEILQAGGADFMVAQKGTADLSFSSIPEGDRDALAQLPQVEQATGILFHITRVGSNPYFPMLGIAPDALTANPPHLLAGVLLAGTATDEIVLGSRAASELGIGVGDSVSIGERSFRIVGVFQSGNTFEDAGGFVTLPVVQELARRPGSFTVIYVHVKPGTKPDAVAKQIESQFPQLTAISNLADYGEVDQGMNVIDAANLAISILAIGIGAVGVMNTMVMSVFERTREIGILRAVGWSGSRIIRMIIGESLVMCVFAAGFGVLFGMLAIRAVLVIPAVKSFLEPQYSLEIFTRALLVAVGVALFGAAYPALRAVRLTPMEALRHE